VLTISDPAREIRLLAGSRSSYPLKEWHVKRSKGFTLIELCVVLGIIAILAVTATMYSRHWVTQYRLSNFLRSTEGAIRMARMQAISQGRDCALVFSTQDVDSSTQFLTSASSFKGTYTAVGPYLLTTTDTYAGYQKFFATDNENINTETRVYYLLYNSALYSISDITTGPSLGTWDSSADGTTFNLKFNSRGFPWIYVGSSPRSYQTRKILLESKTYKNSKGRIIEITPNGKIYEGEGRNW
jgi:prepilin-type N-terminal cleavage/methylation domain-containing protein